MEFDEPAGAGFARAQIVKTGSREQFGLDQLLGLVDFRWRKCRVHQTINRASQQVHAGKDDMDSNPTILRRNRK